MGEVRVPAAAKWQAQTQRAVENFPISGRPVPPPVVHALARIKGGDGRRERRAAASRGDVADAIDAAAAEVAAGAQDDQFPIDMFQTGSRHLART